MKGGGNWEANRKHEAYPLGVSVQRDSVVRYFKGLSAGGSQSVPYHEARYGQKRDQVKGVPSCALKASLPASGLRTAHSSR